MCYRLTYTSTFRKNKQESKSPAEHTQRIPKLFNFMLREAPCFPDWVHTVLPPSAYPGSFCDSLATHTERIPPTHANSVIRESFWADGQGHDTS